MDSRRLKKKSINIDIFIRSSKGNKNNFIDKLKDLTQKIRKTKIIKKTIKIKKLN